MLGAIIGNMAGAGFAHEFTHTYKFTLADGRFLLSCETVFMAAICDLLCYTNKPAIGRIEKKLAAREIAQILKKYARYYPELLDSPHQKWAASPGLTHCTAQADFSPVFALPCAYAYDSLDNVLAQTELACEKLCDTDTSRSCATALNSAVYALHHGAEKDNICDYIVGLADEELTFNYDECRENLGFARDPKAALRAGFAAFIRSYDFDSALRYAIACGAMPSVTAAVAGALAGEYYREIPKELSENFDSLALVIRQPIEQFITKYSL